MKQYKVECKTIRNNNWWSLDIYDELNKAKDRIEQEKTYDKYYKKDPENWVYRIMVRDVPDWEIYKDGN